MKTIDLKFKILRPWVVLESGDVINNQTIMHLCEKQSENVKNGGKLLHIEDALNGGPLNWPKHICSIESIGDLYDKKYLEINSDIQEQSSDSFTGDSSMIDSSQEEDS